MEKAELLRKLRGEIGDNQEPYRIPDPQLSDIISDTIGDYSRYRPRKKKGALSLVPGTVEYQFPDDYQTWLSGLENHEILDKTLYLDAAPVGTGTISYTYLGDHTIETVPVRDAAILIDYCMWKLLSDIVREGAEISGLKLGKGLEIKFDNFDEISKLAARRLDNYNRNVKLVVGGCT